MTVAMTDTVDGFSLTDDAAQVLVLILGSFTPPPMKEEPRIQMPLAAPTTDMERTGKCQVQIHEGGSLCQEPSHIKAEAQVKNGAADSHDERACRGSQEDLGVEPC